MRSLDRHDDYDRATLDVADVAADPIAQFGTWLGDAEHAGLPEPNAMVLSTVGPDGLTSRTVLLKGVVDGAFELVTNAESRKGRALAADGRTSLLFPWYALQRQVLIDGDARRAADDVSDGYWRTRPRASQIGAWASRQSEPVRDRAALDEQVEATEVRFAGVDEIPRPPHWGSWLVTPRRIEFWQGRPSRLHDRIVFHRDDDGWTIERLQP